MKDFYTMKIIYNPSALLDLPSHGILIPLTDERITKIKDFITSIKKHPVDWVDDAIKVDRKLLAYAHTEDYLGKLFGPPEVIIQAVSDTFELVDKAGNYHRYDPSQATRSLEHLVDQVLLQIKGTLSAVKEALTSGDCFYLGGGYHHAMSFAGRGFCLINDVVIAARWAQRDLGVKRVWIIDVDAHKGDGTAEITKGDPSIRTLSIHMETGWPLDSDRFDHSGNLNPWFIESDVEIGIGIGEEDRYLQRLSDGLSELEALDEGKPDLAIVVQGSDPYEKDELPSSNQLRLTREQLLQRDLLVYEFLKQRSIPQAYVMAGGYGAHSYEIYCQFLDRVIS